MTTVADGLFQYGGMPVGPGGMPVLLGKQARAFFVDPVNGADGNDGLSPQRALATLYRAHNLMTAGQNDTCFLLGNGAASGTARLSVANAVAAKNAGDADPTTGTLTWSKAACHLIGVTSVSRYGRARIAPPSGTYTEATFNALPFITVSADGCHFQNLSIFHGFSTGADGMIALNVSGGRNSFVNVSVLGMNDAASAQGTASRSLKVTGTGENTFVNCQIGGDTTTRTVANASLELAGATPRNSFYNCTFPFQTSNAGVLGILGTGNGCVDRWTLFDGCAFINNIKSTSTQMTVLASFTTASPGGLLYFKGCATVGMTKFGDTNGLANSYIDMAAVSASAGGLGANPS